MQLEYGMSSLLPGLSGQQSSASVAVVHIIWLRWLKLTAGLCCHACLALQELVIEFDQGTMDRIRVEVMSKLKLLKDDYKAMLYGGSVREGWRVLLEGRYIAAGCIWYANTVRCSGHYLNLRFPYFSSELAPAQLHGNNLP